MRKQSRQELKFCTHADFKTANEPSRSLVELAADAVETRAVLLADVQVLITRHLLPASTTDRLQGASGYKNVMMDLGTLAGILRNNAAKVAARTSVQPKELTAAEDLANRFGRAIGVREQSLQVVAEATRRRQAAYTLCVGTYNQVRAGVQYIRRNEGDVDAIAPSLFANRGLRRKPVDSEPENTGSSAPATAQATTVSKAAAAHNATNTSTSTSAEDGPFA